MNGQKMLKLLTIIGGVGVAFFSLTLFTNEPQKWMFAIIVLGGISEIGAGFVMFYNEAKQNLVSSPFWAILAGLTGLALLLYAVEFST